MLDKLKNLAENLTKNEDAKAITAIAATASAASSAATAAGISSMLAVTTTSGPGILVALGLGTTTTVALPVAGVVAAGGLIGYGVYKGVKIAQGQK